MATERNPSFFKVLHGDQFSNKLRIPNAFLQCFNGRVPPHCLLKSRDRSWIVYVEKVDHKYYFQHGWNGFVQGNGINCGEFLIFHYAGNSHFHVEIFGTNTCKKLHVLPEMKEANEHDDGDESPDILEYFPPCPRKTEEKSLLLSLPPYKSNEASSSGKADITPKFGKKCPVLEKSAMKKRKRHWLKSKSAMKKKKGHRFKSKMIDFSDNDSGDEDDSEKYYEDDDHDEEVDEESADEEEEETEDEDKEEEDDDSVEFLNDSPGCSRTVRRYTSTSRVHKRKRKSSTAKAKNKIKAVGGPSREEKYKKFLARQIANTFKSDSVNPCFVVSMCATYASGIFLRLPQRFVMEHLINLQPSCFTLRVGKICWSVKAVRYREATILGAGWSKFVRANNLKFGDACAFVMTNAIKFEFDVEIFRGTDAIRT